MLFCIAESGTGFAGSDELKNKIREWNLKAGGIFLHQD